MPGRCGWVFNDGDFSGDCERGPKFDGVVKKSGADLGLLMLFVSEMWQAMWEGAVAKFGWSWTSGAVCGYDGVASGDRPCFTGGGKNGCVEAVGLYL